MLNPKNLRRVLDGQSRMVQQDRQPGLDCRQHSQQLPRGQPLGLPGLKHHDAVHPADPVQS
jgi:hypothetical protein